MVIAMDYDKTLSDIKLQGLAKKILREGNEFWVVTARKDNAYNKDIMKHVLDKLKLTEHQVIFCNEKPKWEMLQMINADIYIDNISDEFEAIKNFTNTTPLLWV